MDLSLLDSPVTAILRGPTSNAGSSLSDIGLTSNTIISIQSIDSLRYQRVLHEIPVTLIRG